MTAKLTLRSLCFHYFFSYCTNISTEFLFPIVTMVTANANFFSIIIMKTVDLCMLHVSRSTRKSQSCKLPNAIFTVFVFNMLHCDEKFNMPGYVHSLYFL